MPDTPDNPEENTAVGLDTVYTLTSPDQASGFYDRWANAYDADVTQNGYATPHRCAEALAAHATRPEAPLMDLACGTGLSGVALAEQGFTCIDGFDISEGMLEKARETGVYRDLHIVDLSSRWGSSRASIITPPRSAASRRNTCPRRSSTTCWTSCRR